MSSTGSLPAGELDPGVLARPSITLACAKLNVPWWTGRRRRRARCQRRMVDRAKKKYSGFVFKDQANMDPKHRAALLFMRCVSGCFERYEMKHCG